MIDDTSILPRTHQIAEMLNEWSSSNNAPLYAVNHNPKATSQKRQPKQRVCKCGTPLALHNKNESGLCFACEGKRRTARLRKITETTNMGTGNALTAGNPFHGTGIRIVHSRKAKV